MSLPTVAAARIYEGQLKGQSGEENFLSFETMPYTGLSKTYNTDSQTPDSAGTMSAIMTGIKTRKGVLSVEQTGMRGDCQASKNQHLITALELAEFAGLSTGVVTTCHTGCDLCSYARAPLGRRLRHAGSSESDGLS